MKTEAERESWAGRYQAALRWHLKQGTEVSLLPAMRLGRQAAALGLETLDLALLHKKALITVIPSDAALKTRESMVEQATLFFSEALVPIEKQHGRYVKTAARVSQLSNALRQRTVESTASAQSLARSISKRQESEKALEKSRKAHKEMLCKSEIAHKLLRKQMRIILAAQEQERKKTSRQLQDDVAQTLLAINIGLLALQASVKNNTDKLSKMIANTQRLVRESVKKVKGVRL